MRNWRGIDSSLIVATALHVAIVGALAFHTTPTVPAPAALAPEPTVEIEVAAEDAPIAMREAAEAPALASEHTSLSSSRAEPRAATAASATTDPSVEIVTAPERATDWVVNPTGKIDLAVPRTAFARGGVFDAPPTTRPVDPSGPVGPSRTGGLVEGLDGRDQDVGLGRSGPVRSAVEAAAHDPSAPSFGIATFSVSVLEGGKIHIDLLDANQERSGWEKLAPIIAKGLADKNVHVPGNAKGIRVTVKVEASEQFPGGARPLPPEKQGVQAGAKFFKVHESKDHIAIELPEAHLGYAGRKCGVDVSVNPGGVSLAGGCEVGVAMRVVETHVVSEERL